MQGHYTAPVVDADPDAPVPWLATAYIAGPSLQGAVSEHGRLPLFTAFRLLAGAAEGVAAVHAADLIHRDLKPANVLLAEDGPRVIDFGIVHAANSSTLTGKGNAIGTPATWRRSRSAARSARPPTSSGSAISRSTPQPATPPSATG